MVENQAHIRLKKFRKALRYTQDQLAKHVETRQATYGAYETGRRGIPLPMMETLLIKFGLNLNWLIGGVGDMMLKPRTGYSEEYTMTPKGMDEPETTDYQRPDTMIEQIIKENTHLKEMNQMMKKSLENNQFLIDTLRRDLAQSGSKKA